MAATNDNSVSTVKSPNSPNNRPSSSLGHKNSVLLSKTCDKDKLCSEISYKEFLDFLRTAYQINEALDETSANELGTTKKELDWKEVAANKLINSLLKSKEEVERKDQARLKASIEDTLQTKSRPNSAKSKDSDKFSETKKGIVSDSQIVGQDVGKGVEHLVKRKLSEIISEGLLDSVLPYVVPKTLVNTALPPPTKKATVTTDVKKVGEKSGTTAFTLTTAKEKPGNARRKSSTGEAEVEIHVCDEVKNLKKDFRCPQKLLVSKMGYFAEVTTGQKLEDMDISVHCDITIFDWLMRWVKRDATVEGQGPHLDASNVVPILVSAAFLQMDPLLEDCLSFCRAHISDIVLTSTNLSCLNDTILTRLANMFSNTDLELVRDRKDKIVSRLYCKLIMSLTDSSPDVGRGHYASLANLYRCSECGKLVAKHLATDIPCVPANMAIDRNGDVSSTHVRDVQWTLSEHVRAMHGELKSWRAVYWRLWGSCHFLRCATCCAVYPLRQTNCCAHHPDAPQFFNKDNHRAITFPIGRYPCCGERCYRFQVLENKTGCQHKQHQAVLTDERDAAVHALFLPRLALVAEDAPEVTPITNRLTRLVSAKESGKEEQLWWSGLQLAPARPRLGVLAKWEAQQKKEEKPAPPPPAAIPVPAPVLEPTRSAILSRCSSVAISLSDEEDMSDDSSDNSEESNYVVKTKTRRASVASRYYADTRSDGGRNWTMKLSTRMNQDNQRDYEERLVTRMATLLTRRTGNDTRGISRSQHWLHASGGAFLKAEHDWREEFCHSSLGRQRSVTQSSSRSSSRYRNVRN